MLDVTFDFPPSLVKLQQEWFAADRARTAAARSGDDDAFRAAHKRLLDLTEDLDEKLRPYGAPHQARMALREAARDG
jgi:hypothetical protein